MARKEITQYYDDLDNTQLERDEVQVMKFSLNGNNYVLDLSQENADKFRAVLEPYIRVARRERAVTPTRRRGSAPKRNSRAAEIRKWAQEQGKNVADRGKIPEEIIQAYDAAH